MKVVVGSQNPVKIAAVEKAFQAYFKEVSVLGYAVSSGVSVQPRSAEESYEGASRRASAVLESTKADFGVGIEGGLEQFFFGTTTSGFVVIKSRDGRVGFGMSARMRLPESFVSRLQTKKTELGDLVDELTGGKNLKQQGGMFGVFTKGVVTREDAYYQAVVFALSRFISEEYYDRENI